MFTKEYNQVLDRILNARKTCRAFAENVPTDDEIKEVIQAGCIAPYASIDAKAVTPFRHFFVIKKDDPKMEQIDAFIRQQSQVDLDARRRDRPFFERKWRRGQKIVETCCGMRGKYLPKSTLSDHCGRVAWCQKGRTSESCTYDAEYVD